MNLVPFGLSVLRQHWRWFVLAALLAAVAAQTLRLGAAQSARDAAIAGRAVDRAAYAHAQETARTNALAAAAKKDAENEKKADDADTRYADLSARYRAASLRYAAAQSPAGRADLSETPKIAESVDGPREPAVIPAGNIIIPQEDALICADNTARLQAAHEWALTASN